MTQSEFNEFMTNYLISLAKEEPSNWSEEARIWCEQQGIIEGDQNGNKMYKKFVTKEEIASIIYKLKQKGYI
jgi:hypothetical protein